MDTTPTTAASALVLPDPVPDALLGPSGAPAPGVGHRLVRDAATLIGSQGATAVLGLAFWAVTARGYPADEVGRAAAVISSAVVLGTLANLSLGAMYERFLPLAGDRAGRAIAGGHALSAVVAVLLSAALVVWGPRDELFTAPWQLAAFPVLVVVLAVYIVQDQIAVGLHQARWAGVKNVAHAVAKLAVVVALASTASGTSIVASWGVCALLCSVVFTAAVARRLRAAGPARLAPPLPPRRALLAYAGASYATTSIAVLAPLAVPLLVLDGLGPESSAHFAVAWSLVVAFLGLLTLVVGPYVAAASTTPDRLRPLTQRIAVVLLGVGVGGGVFLALFAPLLLQVVGAPYAAAGTPLLRLMAVALPLAVVGVLYAALARVHRRLRLALLTQLLSAVVVVVGTRSLVGSYGLAGVGLAYVAAELVVAAVLAAPLVRWLRAALRAGGPERSQAGS